MRPLGRPAERGTAAMRPGSGSAAGIAKMRLVYVPGASEPAADFGCVSKHRVGSV